MPSELPASALYSSPSLGRLWQKVHLACSPFILRRSVRKLYERPIPILRRHLAGIPYHWIALGCADGQKESLLAGKLPPPASFHAADTNLSLARRAAARMKGARKSCGRINLNAQLPVFRQPFSQRRLFTLFGVLPNLPPFPLLRRLSQTMRKGDLLLLSANLAPGESSLAGARKVLPQYDNHLTRQWLESTVRRFRPRLLPGRLVFGVFPDPHQRSLARIEARWISGRRVKVVLASRRPTPRQVEAWIQRARLRKIGRFLEPRQEEGIWLVTR